MIATTSFMRGRPSAANASRSSAVRARQWPSYPGGRPAAAAAPIPLQLFAYSTRHLLAMDDTRRLRGSGSLLGGRILELLRIRSAQLGECQPCMQSRKHDSITDEDVACLLGVGGGDLTEQEALAIEFLDLLSADHHAIDADFYRRLAK